MRKIIKFLKQFMAEDFHSGVYLLNFLFLSVCIGINYYYDFEDSVIDAYSGKEIRILYYFLFYSFAYYGSCLILFWCKKGAFLFSGEFWIKSVLFLLLISFDAAFYYHRPIIHNHFPYELQYFFIKCLNNLTSLLTIVLPLLLFYILYEKEENGFFGFRTGGIDLKPYWTLLLLMVPLIITASFSDDFLDQYPNLKDNPAANYLNIPQWKLALLFEFAYAWDFVSVELAFRGFLIIGMIKILEKGAVLPMIVTYAFYHFGKPAGETISSVFGGYILGTIAYYTRSILGGIIVHVGIAWLMDLFAYLQKSPPDL